MRAQLIYSNRLCSRKVLDWNCEVGLWCLLSLLELVPARYGKHCLVPEVLRLLMLGEAHPVGPSNNVESKTAGRSVPMAGCATAEEKYHMDAYSHQATTPS